MSHDCEEEGHMRCPTCGRCPLTSHSGKPGMKKYMQDCIYFLSQDARMNAMARDNWREAAWSSQRVLRNLEWNLFKDGHPYGTKKTTFGGVVDGKVPVSRNDWRICREPGCGEEAGPWMYCRDHTTPERKKQFTEELKRKEIPDASGP